MPSSFVPFFFFVCSSLCINYLTSGSVTKYFILPSSSTKLLLFHSFIALVFFSLVFSFSEPHSQFSTSIFLVSFWYFFFVCFHPSHGWFLDLTVACDFNMYLPSQSSFACGLTQVNDYCSAVWWKHNKGTLHIHSASYYPKLPE